MWKHGYSVTVESESHSVVSRLFVTPWTIYIVHGILQARILEWVAFPFSRESSQPRDQTQVSRIADRFFTSWATREATVELYSNFQVPEVSEPPTHIRSSPEQADTDPVVL